MTETETTLLSPGETTCSLPESLRTWLCIGMIVYVAVMLGIGWFSSKKIRGMKDFLVAGRRLPLWMATATLLATWFGAGSSMGVAATVYRRGLPGVLADPFGASASLILAGIFVVGLLRKQECLTVTDIIERHYGKWAGIYTSAWMIPVYTGWIGAQVLGMGTIFHVLTGMNITAGTIAAAGIVLLYTVAGGMWAVTLTDVVQVTLILAGFLLIMPGAVTESGGGHALLQSIPPAELSIGKPENVPWTYYLGSWMIMGLGCMVGQDLIQRSLSSRNEKIAVTSSILSGFLYLAVAVVPVTIGFAARIVLAKYNITEETMGADLENQVLPRMAILILGKLSPAILILFLCALVSAILSSADSSLLAGSSLLANNIVRPLFPELRDGKLLLATRIATVVLTVLGTYLALNVKSIYSLMINSWASQLVIVFLPVIGALYFKKSGKICVWACMGLATAVWLGYLGVGSAKIPLDAETVRQEGFLSALVQSDDFDRVLTCGAVWGFVCGAAAFFLAYPGEWILGKKRRKPNDSSRS